MLSLNIGGKQVISHWLSSFTVYIQVLHTCIIWQYLLELAGILWGFGMHWYHMSNWSLMLLILKCSRIIKQALSMVLLCITFQGVSRFIVSLCFMVDESNIAVFRSLTMILTLPYLATVYSGDSNVWEQYCCLQVCSRSSFLRHWRRRWKWAHLSHSSSGIFRCSWLSP